MKLLQERNWPLLGLLSTVVLTLVVLAALMLDTLPFVGGGGTYAAEFTEAAGLTDTAEVRINGVKVGAVEDVTLEGDHIRVEFTVEGVRLGSESRASIEIKTLLGQKYLEVTPAGPGELDPGTPIPRSRTRVPYDIAPVAEDLSRTVQALDADRIAESLRVLSDTFQGSGRHLRGAMEGLSRISTTIASRDRELAALFADARAVSGLVASRDRQFRALIADGDALLAEMQRRKSAISGLLDATIRLSGQLRGLVRDNQLQIGPALAELDRVTTLLRRNRDNLGEGLENLAPLVRLSNNVIGNGRFFETYLCGLLPPSVDTGPLAVNPDGCPPATAKGAR